MKPITLIIAALGAIMLVPGSGDISFVLRAAKFRPTDELKWSRGNRRTSLLRLNGRWVNGRLTTPARQVLTVHFVRSEGRRVIGVLDPYIDPDCACRMTTTFEGAFTDGHTVEGDL
jgi:hypothetical protein